MPARGEIWLADPDPSRGREQAGVRPFVIVSNDYFNRSGYEVVFAAPLTRRDRGFRLHVPVLPPEGGVRAPGFVMCEQLRSMSLDRFRQRWGELTAATMTEVDLRIRRLLEP
jgi:mRNA interferase MazF